MTDSLTERLLAKPVGPTISAKAPSSDAFTRKIEVRDNNAELELRDVAAELINEGTALAYLEEEGLNPEEWEATHFRKIKYGAGLQSVKVSYKRVAYLGGDRPNVDELIAEVKRHKPKANRAQGDHAAIIAMGDMQFGKIDGDGVEGTTLRVISYLNKAADLIESYRKRFDIGHVHIAFLGDHCEGFLSQGGANVWRTPLTLSEQIRLTRRSMLHALTTFTPLVERLSLVAVPGNHGETTRFAGKGVTRYDDSHDTESLIAVMDAAELNPATFGHVEFYVPQTDELTVVTQAAGTTIGHAHGHQWRNNKHFDWWRGQAFHNAGMDQAGLLLAGHMHHLVVDSDGPRRFIQVPSFESESTWFRHTSGSIGNPGLVLAITKDNKTNIVEAVQ